MGESVENVYYGPHAAAGQVTGWRLTVHKGATSYWLDLGDANGNAHAVLMSAARTSQAAFDALASSVWGSAYDGLALGVRQSARAAVAAY